MRHEEHEIQKSICQYLDIALPPEWRYFAVPNGGNRDVREAARLKAEGVKAGVPDLVIVSPDGMVHFLEVKRPVKSRMSDAQKEWRDWCRKHDIRHAVVTSINDVQKVLTDWGISVRLKLV